jgi:hypothetical protein
MKLGGIGTFDLNENGDLIRIRGTTLRRDHSGKLRKITEVYIDRILAIGVAEHLSSTHMIGPLVESLFESWLAETDDLVIRPYTVAKKDSRSRYSGNGGWNWRHYTISDEIAERVAEKFGGRRSNVSILAEALLAAWLRKQETSR